MFAVDAPDNIATVLTAAVVAVPGIIAAWASVRNSRKADHIVTEVTSPNGTTSAQAIHDIKTLVGTVLQRQDAHEALDRETHAAQDQRIEAITKQLGTNPPSPN